MKFFINYFKKDESISKSTTTEATAYAIVDSAFADGAKFISVIAVVPKIEDCGQFIGGEWQAKGETLIDNWCNVYWLGIKDSYK